MYFCCIPQSCCYNQLSTTSPQSAITYCQFENSLCLCDLKLQLTAPFLGIKVNVQRWIFPPIWSFYTSILYFLPKWYGLMGGTISQFYSSLCRAVYLYYKNCSSNNFTVQIAFQQHWRRKMKKAPREMQTLHAGCSKMDPKVFAPPQTPFPAVRDGQNLISWRWSLSLPTNPVWWRSMHAISIYRGNRPTHKHRPPTRPPQTGLITIHCAAKLSVQCNNTKSNNSIHITESHKTTESYVDITSKTYVSFHILPKNNIWC